MLVTKSSTIGGRKRDQYRKCPACDGKCHDPFDKEYVCTNCGGDGRVRVADRNWLGTGKHRIHIVCPECDKLIPAGRLAQHYKHRHECCCQKPDCYENSGYIKANPECPVHGLKGLKRGKGVK